MNILIAGAGEVGRHTAEELVANGHDVVVVDISAAKLELLEEQLDVRTLLGNCAQADVLREAGATKCDLMFAATGSDEINLLAASVGKGVGAKQSVARVHHVAYFGQHGLDYLKHLGIDRLICPEYLTAQAIARTIRNPGALAVEDFARGLIVVQELPVADNAVAVGTSLANLQLPSGVRLAQIHRQAETFIPTAATVIKRGDIVTLVGERTVFEQGRNLFARGESKRQHVVIMGGSMLGTWLCRALKSPHFSVRLFEVKRARAEELAQKLDHVTVLQSDPTELSVFQEERIDTADAFITVTGDDERNILAAAQAKTLGVKTAIVAVKRAVYLHLLEHVGIDRAFSPQAVAANELRKGLDHGPMRCQATLARDTAYVYEIHPTRRAMAIGKELRNLKLPTNCMIAAIGRDDKVKVPGADDVVNFGDTILAIGPQGIERDLKKIFANK